MINEPTIVVECDRCSETIEVSPEFRYRDYSGENGYYDCSDKAIVRLLKEDGWIGNEDRQYCNVDCKKEQEEEE